MPDNRRLILYAALWLIGTVSTSSAQSTQSVNRSPEVPAPTATHDSTPGVPPSALGPKKPGTKEVHPRYPSSALSYGSTPSNYPSGASKLRTEKLDPNTVAARRQSGLSQTEATDQMIGQGYTRVGEVHADPDSIWVWQADAMKNGRRVRLGIDNRGNLLELGTAATPCTIPGTNPMVGGLGVGARLSGTAACR
jgi:hypothetical protein